MPSRKEKNKMIEYIGSQLDAGGHRVIDNSFRFSWNKNELDYLKVDDDRLIFMISSPNEYTKSKTNKMLDELRYQNKGDSLFVFYKDGSNFFRNHASPNNKIKNKFSKLRLDRSLKDYTNEDLNNSIILSEAEKKIRENRKTLQYYQPNSERLEELIVSFRTEPFIFDYSHVPINDRMGPMKRNSKKLHRLTNRIELPEILSLRNLYLENFDTNQSTSS